MSTLFMGKSIAGIQRYNSHVPEPVETVPHTGSVATKIGDERMLHIAQMIDEDLSPKKQKRLAAYLQA